MGSSWTLGAGWRGGGWWQRGTGARYLAVIKSASTSSPTPSTSTTRASSYFCTVLEHKVTWEEKGDKLLLGTASSLHGGTGAGAGVSMTSKCFARRLWCFREQVTWGGGGESGMVDAFKCWVRNPMLLAQWVGSFLR